MGLLSNKIKREQLKAGDHIYSWRNAYLYAHHGIYIGGGLVIHFTRGTVNRTVLDRIIFSSLPARPSDNSCPMCGDNSKDGVILSCIDCFLYGGEPYLFEYKTSKALFLAKPRGGTCTLAKSDPPKDVVHRADFLLQNGFGVYDVFKNNCENFAIYCKTGLLVATSLSGGRSGQAASLEAAVSAFTKVKGVVYAPLRYLNISCTGLASCSGLAAVGYGMYCVDRLVSDIGVRRDVAKVPVESLVAMMQVLHVAKQE